MVYWVLKTIVVGPILRVLFRPWIEGEHHIPSRGGAILASNHLSFSDSIFLPLMVNRRITFPAKMEYFTGTGLKGWAIKTFFTATGQIPIDRAGGEASMAAMRQGLKFLRRGELFGIYPEGTRSPDGRLYRGKTGMARLAVEAGVPIIPVAMVDTDKAQPTGQKIPNLHQVGMRIGAPLDFSRYAGQEEDRSVLRTITDEVMAALASVSGQEYVDEYASVVKQRLSAESRARKSAATKAAMEDAKASVGRAGDQMRERTVDAATSLSDRIRRDGDGAATAAQGPAQPSPAGWPQHSEGPERTDTGDRREDPDQA
ncbi:MAG: lysophospholipid acyltransferase family protein [Ornithinimicrobium sp.]